MVRQAHHERRVSVRPELVEGLSSPFMAMARQVVRARLVSRASQWMSFEGARQACKPGSVSFRGRTVAIYLGPTLPADSSSQPGDGPGAHSPPIRPCSRWGLAASVSPRMAGRSYRPISPLPKSLLRATRAVCFCATFHPPAGNPSANLRTAHKGPGNYPAPCPVEPGLSSPPPLSGRGSGHPAYLAGPPINVPHPLCVVNLSSMAR